MLVCPIIGDVEFYHLVKVPFPPLELINKLKSGIFFFIRSWTQGFKRTLNML